jgi:hypothetical protein
LAGVIVGGSCLVMLTLAALTPSTVLRAVLAACVVATIALVLWTWRREQMLVRRAASDRDTSGPFRAKSVSGESQGTVIVHRVSRRADLLRAYVVEIDGEDVGTVRDGETLQLQVATGPHTARVRVDWLGSPPVNVSVPPRGAVRLRCANAVTNPLQFVRAMTGARNRYLLLELD